MNDEIKEIATTVMNRRLDLCSDCPCFMKIDDKLFGEVYACRKDAFFCSDGTLEGFPLAKCSGLSSWNWMAVSPECDRYADYFVKECNK